MSAKALKLADIRVGMDVTVLQTGYWGGLKGVVLTVLSIDDPYVLVEYVEPKIKATIDSRDTTFMALTPAYVIAQTGRPPAADVVLEEVLEPGTYWVAIDEITTDGMVELYRQKPRLRTPFEKVWIRADDSSDATYGKNITHDECVRRFDVLPRLIKGQTFGECLQVTERKAPPEFWVAVDSNIDDGYVRLFHGKPYPSTPRGIFWCGSAPGLNNYIGEKITYCDCVRRFGVLPRLIHGQALGECLKVTPVARAKCDICIHRQANGSTCPFWRCPYREEF